MSDPYIANILVLVHDSARAGHSVHSAVRDTAASAKRLELNKLTNKPQRIPTMP